MNSVVKMLALCSLLLPLSCHYKTTSYPAYLSDADLAYRYLEAKQESAYRKASVGQKRSWDEARSREIALDKCDERFTNLPEALTWITGYPPLTSQGSFIEQSVCLALRNGTTTRHEIVSSYIPSRLLLEALIQTASTVKGTRLIPTDIRLGTLPIISIDARTFAVPETDKNIIIVSKGSLELASHFTEFALSSIWVRADDEIAVQDTYPVVTTRGERRTVQRRNVDYSDQTFRDMFPVQSIVWLKNYALAFITGEDDILQPSRCSAAWDDNVCRKRPLGAYKQRLLTAMVQAMGLFVLGHELGHIIMGHETLGDQEIRIDSTKPTAKSWRDEIAADEMGAILMVKSIKEFRLDFGDPLIQAYQLVAPLLFLEYVRIVDEARYAMEQEKQPPEIDKNDVQDTLSAYIEAQETGDERHLLEEFGNYPPTWLRSLRLEDLLLSNSKLSTFSEEERHYAGLGLNLKSRIRDLARLANHDFAEHIFTRKDLFRKHPVLERFGGKRNQER